MLDPTAGSLKILSSSGYDSNKRLPRRRGEDAQVVSRQKRAIPVVGRRGRMKILLLVGSVMANPGKRDEQGHNDMKNAAISNSWHARDLADKWSAAESP